MILRTEGIARTFLRQSKGTNFFYAVETTDFELEEGKLTEIFGKSGSGKSTFLNMIAGLLTPTEGKVFVGDKDLYSLEDNERSKYRNENIGIVPQGQTGLQSLTVLENVLLPCKMYGNMEKKEEYAKELLTKLGLEKLFDVYPNELSGGELRRMAIARALIMEPKILLADEPTGDLDDENTEIVLSIFKNLIKNGTSILMVTHEKDAAKYADVIYRMNFGKLSKDEIYKNPNTLESKN